MNTDDLLDNLEDLDGTGTPFVPEDPGIDYGITAVPSNVYPGGFDVHDQGNLVQSLIPSNIHTGAMDISEAGQIVGSIVGSNTHPGGFEIQHFSERADDQMESVLGDLTFDLAEVLLPWDADESTQPVHDQTIVGTPGVDAAFWQPQTTSFTCAVQAQRGIIEAFTGEDVSEAQLVYDATTNGWLTDGGMSPHDVGRLLELYGVDCHSVTGATVEELVAELAQGHKVVIGVDSGELWESDSPLEDFFGQAADHAIWVTGIDFSDPDHPQVIINDSGDPSGSGKAYDLAHFVDAWQDSGFFYVATDSAPPEGGLAASGFDSAGGGFSDLIAWLGRNVHGAWEHLNSDEGRTQVANATATIAGIATFVKAADVLAHSVFELFDDSASDAVLQLI